MKGIMTFKLYDILAYKLHDSNFPESWWGQPIPAWACEHKQQGSLAWEIARPSPHPEMQHLQTYCFSILSCSQTLTSTVSVQLERYWWPKVGQKMTISRPPSVSEGVSPKAIWMGKSQVIDARNCRKQIPRHANKYFVHFAEGSRSV